MTTNSTEFDVAIVGGGVAGSSAAIALRQDGFQVVLFERETAFRDRVRGEGIHPWGIDEADDLGLRPILAKAGAQPLPIWQSWVNREPIEPFRWADESLRGNVEHGVFHPRLQETLLTHAVAIGVEVRRGWSFQQFEADTDRVRVLLNDSSADRTFTATILIGADGSRSKVRSGAGIELQRDPVHHQFAGLLIEARSLPDDTAQAGLLPGGRFFILPQGDGRARLYAALIPDRMASITADRSGNELLELVSSCIPNGFLANARVVGPQGIFPNADTWADRGADDRMVLVGDAAGANDPSIGHGMSLSFRDARELRDAIRNQGLTTIALADFAMCRGIYLATLREIGRWMGELWIEEGPEADVRRAQFIVARQTDPEIDGLGTVTSRGPQELVVTDTMRSRFFGGIVNVDGEAGTS